MEQLKLNLDDYIEAKHKIKEKLNETVHNFITIGYYLKQIRDSGLFRRDGYRNMEEFARTEYGLSAGTASRFMNINTEFSKDGNSLEIQDEYKNYAYSKLQEMLTVAPDDRELITESTTVQQIKDIKAVEREEKQAAEEKEQMNPPLVQMAAGDNAAGEAGTEPETAPPDPADLFGRILTAFWNENTELYNRAAAGMLTPEIAAEEICPSGSRLYRNGTDMLFFYDYDRGLKLRGYADGNPVITAYTYQEFLERTAGINIQQKDNKPLPEETVATSQYPQQKQTETETANHGTETVNSGTETVIDAEYRELGSSTTEDAAQKKSGQQTGYTDEEVKNAINYFNIEYIRMVGLRQDGTKKKSYKIALECIRKCYKDIAKQVDREDYGYNNIG